MANKMPWYITLDWKSLIIGGILSIIIGLSIFILIKSNSSSRTKLDIYKGEVSGILISVAENKEMSQSRLGTRIYVGSYTVTYEYQVNGIIYQGEKRLPATAKSKSFLQKVKNSKTLPLRIKYDFLEPSRSILLIE